ncbi:MAG: hypothetical protein AAGF92_20775 [Myxococcota bacterium]
MGVADPKDVSRKRRSTWRWRGGCARMLPIALVLPLGCGDSVPSVGPGGDAGTPGLGGMGGSPVELAVAAVRIDSAPLEGTRLGHRWVLRATALDAFGEPVSDVAFAWSSSDPSVASVSEVGVVTTHRAGVAEISARAAGYSDAVALTSRSAVPSDVGEMLTTWFARSDDAPVALVDGALSVFDAYEGSAAPTTPWSHGAVAHFAWSGDRLGILTDVVDGLGTLRVLWPGAEWTVLRVGDVTGFQLEGDWIAEHGEGGSLRIREGLDGDWISLAASGIVDYQLLGSRIAVLTDGGDLRAKDGVDDAWTLVAQGVRSFLLGGDRIAVLLEEGDGTLEVQDGLDGAKTMLELRVRKVDLSGERIGVLRKDGVARVKEGVEGPWVQLASSYVEELQLEGDRMAIQFEGGDLRARDGVNGPWTTLTTVSRSFVLQGDYVGVLTNAGELWFRTGLEGSWSKVTPAGSVGQLLPIAPIPVPPVRTSVAPSSGTLESCDGLGGWQCPVTYDDAQAACVSDGARCVATPDDADPAYGRFCGAGRPLDEDRNWALSVGPIDVFDALCMHADQAASWYADAQGVAPEGCIFRYGLTSARLTNDGEIIPLESPQYAETMGKMTNLSNAIGDPMRFEDACDDDQFAAFIEAMQAGH